MKLEKHNVSLKPSPCSLSETQKWSLPYPLAIIIVAGRAKYSILINVTRQELNNN